ncbi:oxidoreductase [Colletotrichum sojae]|uniref:Oxidoreductase n=1 Tax=Colletotrichum sojae TaxID=2175907 RepID=A0A8H6IUE5_9PEZI|nr:oxidoreductase [Colletotrichum sojae]
MSTPTTNNNKRREMGATLKSLARDLCDAITADDDHPMSIFALGGEVHIKTPAVKTRRASKKAQNASAHAPEEENASDPIVIYWGPPNDPTAVLGMTHFPLTSDADEKGFEKLLKDTQAATFGRGGDEVLDETYRKAKKLPATAFATSLCPYKLGIIDTVRQVLLPSIETAEGSRLIRAELYNINISFHISNHANRTAVPKKLQNADLFWSIGKVQSTRRHPPIQPPDWFLVVCLPMEHKGGEFAVRQDGRSHTFDWGANSEKPLIQWAAFYSDCEHEVFEVKSGHRVTMTYNLYATPGSSSPARQLPAFSPASLPLYGKINALVASKRFQRKDRIIGFYSTHAYPHTVGEKHRNLPLCLKGIDMAVYETFRSLGATVHLCSVVEHKDTDDGRTASDIETDGGKFSDGQADSAPSKKTAKAKKTRWRRSNNAPGHSLSDGSRPYGNEASMDEVYFHFAMGIEIPAGSIAA